jgi:hypothetical protein
VYVPRRVPGEVGGHAVRLAAPHDLHQHDPRLVL